MRRPTRARRPARRGGPRRPGPRGAAPSGPGSTPSSSRIVGATSTSRAERVHDPVLAHALPRQDERRPGLDDPERAVLTAVAALVLPVVRRRSGSRTGPAPRDGRRAAPPARRRAGRRSRRRSGCGWARSSASGENLSVAWSASGSRPSTGRPRYSPPSRVGTGPPPRASAPRRPPSAALSTMSTTGSRDASVRTASAGVGGLMVLSGPATWATPSRSQSGGVMGRAGRRLLRSGVPVGTMRPLRSRPGQPPGCRPP